MGKYNREMFKILTVRADIHRRLKNLKSKPRESFSDVIEGLLKQVTGAIRRMDTSYSFVRPVDEETKSFYRSDLFG